MAGIAMEREGQLENNGGGGRVQAWATQSLVQHWEYSKGTVERWGSWGLKKREEDQGT